MQIARLSSAGVAPLAMAEIQVMPLNTRGDEERCSATRVCEVMSRRKEPRAIQRSKVMERARWAGAKLDGIAETGVVGVGEDGLKVEIRTVEENQLHVESIY